MLLAFCLLMNIFVGGRNRGWGWVEGGWIIISDLKLPQNDNIRLFFIISELNFV